MLSNQINICLKAYKTGIKILFCFLCLSGATEATASSTLEAQRSLFIAAEKALQTGQESVFKKLKKQLVQYPLYPYLLYADFDRRMHAVSLEELNYFLNNYADSPLSEQLQTRWLHAKAKQEQWGAFLKVYEPTEDVALQCHAAWAQLKTRQNNPKTVLHQVMPLWLTGKKPPKSCELVFSVWEESGFMTRPMIWQRIQLLIQEGNKELARRMARYLKKTEYSLVELWIMVHENPYLVTKSHYFKGDHPAYLEMLTDGVSLIAKTKPETAIQIWQQIGHKYRFTERHWGSVVRAIGLAFAFQRHIEAEKWLQKVPASCANSAVHEWRIRVALAKEDWQNVLHWTKALPENLAKAEEWQYWRARALERVSRNKEGQAILAQLAKLRSYYGFLASHHVLKPLVVSLPKITVEQSLVQAMSRRSTILRAHELYALGRMTKAKTEWIFSTARMTDKERHAAANIALKWGLPNWSILALSKADNKNDLEMRFPMVYARHILTEANKHQLDPAWIFAVTRQESAFMPNARSSAGALGLMQLMPATAHMVAKRHSLPPPKTTHLMEPHTNIKLGSGYLKMMLDTHRNNPVLATAAYNAGPGRIRKWAPSFDMAADVWIEIIPFKETREYVKNVLTYTVIYQELLGKSANLHRHMPFVPGDSH